MKKTGVISAATLRTSFRDALSTPRFDHARAALAELRDVDAIVMLFPEVSAFLPSYVAQCAARRAGAPGFDRLAG